MPLRDLGPHKTLQFSTSTHHCWLRAPCERVSFLKSIFIILCRRRHSAGLHRVRVPMGPQSVEIHARSQTALPGDQQLSDAPSQLPSRDSSRLPVWEKVTPWWVTSHAMGREGKMPGSLQKSSGSHSSGIKPGWRTRL